MIITQRIVGLAYSVHDGKQCVNVERLCCCL